MPGVERFRGRVAILTGATQGIGLSSARRLGVEGCKVVVSSRSQENVDTAVKELKNEGIEVSGIVCDQGQKEDRSKLIKHAIDTYGGFDCLFISAGANNHNGNLLTATEKQFDHIFHMNVKSNFQLIQECVPVLAERGGGSILTNATAGTYDPLQSVTKNLLLYSLSKLCLMSMSQQMAPTCFNRKIRLNCVVPGPIKTPFLMGGLTDVQMKSYEKLAGMSFTDDLTGRFGEPEEVASIVAFLLSDDASYINGQCIVAAGGLPFTTFM
ncbi:dehydrogenase/reductase SDR family member 4-like [Apostichopus japonicus]|uniref:dehydrogenase/reductase SDR family member 4-like n=1 Tax=Stichopus japonicus TaxID=307972 RepID=UPI003AB38FA0